MSITSPLPGRAGSVDFVDGYTRLFGIVGHPIRQVRSPQTVTFELRRRGINAILLPLHVLPEDFDSVFPPLLKLANLDGLVVTVPHKTAVPRHLDGIGPLGKFSGSVSILARTSDNCWVGEMFDGTGCVQALQKHGIGLTGQRILLLGAGGAGAAIAAALARTQPASLHVKEPDNGRRNRLRARLTGAFPALVLPDGMPQLDEIDVLINASPVGMLDADRMPIEVDRIPAHVAVLDAIMDPEETRLLHLAKACGCRTVPGRDMLDSQIVSAVDFMMATRTLQLGEVAYPT
ncbi:shikimate dehydrogenase family protein [Pseudohoeflea coraliihabitans]|uniref:Shikimate dehydrogenase substrate binding N-terminal domain-containing protein n=1 Tax=Pseudohoeflea coraliihabitans TaxID=2860393 RepID=A0ABS6WR60_9HYPH|nr:hypothetical protein [Pseudohoeflea sp. DP4N28-3]MBW3098446.1 hypothetical protein [Pseudohoeflea sp. DP4N28-3]